MHQLPIISSIAWAGVSFAPNGALALAFLGLNPLGQPQPGTWSLVAGLNFWRSLWQDYFFYSQIRLFLTTYQLLITLAVACCDRAERRRG